MRYVSFASGSSGNCGLLRGGGMNLLVDAGISARRLCFLHDNFSWKL